MTATLHTEPAVTEVSVTPRPPRFRALLQRPELGVFAAALLLWIFFAVVAGDGGFRSTTATSGWVTASAELGIIALGVGCLVIAGEFDLSVGSMVAASSAVMAVVTGYYGQSIWLGALAALVLAVAVGTFNAQVMLRTGLPSFIVTLASMLALTGASLGVTRLVTGTTIITIPSEGLAGQVFGGEWGVVKAAVVWWVLLALALAWMMTKTVFGIWVYAVGGDLDSAVTNAVPVARVKTRLFILSSICPALVGVLQSVQYSTADSTRGMDFIFSSIAAAVIGGVLLTGGYGTVLGIVLGACTYGIVSTGIFYTGWGTEWSSLLLGVLVLLAVLANDRIRRLTLARGAR